jgi:hypothetical protein
MGKKERLFRSANRLQGREKLGHVIILLKCQADAGVLHDKERAIAGPPLC